MISLLHRLKMRVKTDARQFEAEHDNEVKEISDGGLTDKLESLEPQISASVSKQYNALYLIF